MNNYPETSNWTADQHIDRMKTMWMFWRNYETGEFMTEEDLLRGLGVAQGLRRAATVDGWMCARLVQPSTVAALEFEKAARST